LAFLGAPHALCCCGAFDLRHALVLANVSIDKRLLRWRVGITPAVMRGIKPPVDGEIDRPDGIENMIGEENVGEIKHLLRILVIDSTNSPSKRDEGEGGVDV